MRRQPRRKWIGVTAGWGAPKVWPMRVITHPAAVVTRRKAGLLFCTVFMKASGLISFSMSLLSTVKVESPRPIGRKKNKPAPVPPGLGVTPTPALPPRGAGASPQQVRTPEKEEKKPLSTGLEGTPGEYKPSLPPTGPDSKRLSALPADKKPALPIEKKPALAPRPSLNPQLYAASQSYPGQQPSGIGFEPIEQELRRQGSLRASAPAGSSHKSDDEGLEPRKPPSTGTHKRLSSYENVLTSTVTSNPTHHPNAVSILGGFTLPMPQHDRGRDKVDGEKPRPSVPERPAVIKVQGTSLMVVLFFILHMLIFSFCLNFQAQSSGSSVAPVSQEAHSPTEGKAQGGPAVLERVHSFSVNKQQVSIVHVNSASPAPAPPPTTSSTDTQPDIQHVDSEDSAHSTSSTGQGSYS